MKTIDLASLVGARTKLRFQLNELPDSVRTVAITGRPDSWQETAKNLRAAGKQVMGYYVTGSLPPNAGNLDAPILSPQQVDPSVLDAVVFSGAPVKDWFNGQYPILNECYFSVAPTDWQRRGYHQPDLLEMHTDELNHVFRMLEDDDSRDTLASLIRARIEGDTGYSRLASFPEYNHPIVWPRQGEVAIDAGAFVGNTSKLLASQVGPEGRVLALEPSHKNFVHLARNMGRLGLEQVHPRCVGVWNKFEVLTFDENLPSGASFSISETGSTEIVAYTLDRLEKDHALTTVDLIKFDVEGAERQAIDGARQLISKHRPSILLSIYHYADDLFELPILLDGMLDDYVYFLGHHSHYHMETDLYATPRERLERSTTR